MLLTITSSYNKLSRIKILLTSQIEKINKEKHEIGENKTAVISREGLPRSSKQERAEERSRDIQKFLRTLKSVSVGRPPAGLYVKLRVWVLEYG